MSQKRVCMIASAAIETADGGGDGAYDLLDVAGSPADIGRAVAESLASCDMMRGRTSILDYGGELFLRLTIRFAKVSPEDEADTLEQWKNDDA